MRNCMILILRALLCIILCLLGKQSTLKLLDCLSLELSEQCPNFIQIFLRFRSIQQAMISTYQVLYPVYNNTFY